MKARIITLTLAGDESSDQAVVPHHSPTLANARHIQHHILIGIAEATPFDNIFAGVRNMRLRPISDVLENLFINHTITPIRNSEQNSRGGPLSVIRS
jgi:hypothetical protein